MDKLKIGHRVFAISVVDELIDEDGNSCQGLTNFDNLTIQILKSSPFYDILWHEIEHTLLKLLGISEVLSEREEEVLAEGLANAHLMLFYDNPGLPQNPAKQ